MLTVEDVPEFIEFMQAVDSARRVILAYDQGRQPAGVVAWGLASAGRRAEEAAARRRPWLDDRKVEAR